LRRERGGTHTGEGIWRQGDEERTEKTLKWKKNGERGPKRKLSFERRKKVALGE